MVPVTVTRGIDPANRNLTLMKHPEGASNETKLRTDRGVVGVFFADRAIVRAESSAIQAATDGSEIKPYAKRLCR